MTVTSIRNETPSRLTLVSFEGEEMVLAPLQEKVISEDSGFDFDDLVREGIISQREDTASAVGERIGTAVIGGGFWLVIFSAIIAYQEPFFGIPLTSWPWVVWGSASFLLILIVLGMIISGTSSMTLVIRWTMQAVSLTVILAIGLGLPTATIYYFGDGQALLGKTDPTSTIIELADNNSLALFGRLIQLAFIATASLLPVLLFFLFDRYQLGTLRRRLYINLFRLDRSVTTTGEINARYGSQISEAFGSEDQARGRLSPGSRWPVLVCAFVITIGWIVALAPVGANFNPQSAQDIAASLLPQPTAFVFGFLGVYFYSLRLIALRYARGDLKPKAYTHITVRIFIVAVLSWVLETIFSRGDVTLVLAFLFGITPDEFFIWLKEVFRNKIPASAIPQSTLPLNELEGIDLYDLGRLESEGIVNIEGLAHHELIDLIIETRIPVPRLVDWIDQAILYLHLTGGANIDARSKLRDYGIRSATDLQIAWKKAASRGDASLIAFKSLLGGDSPLYRLEVISDALSDDEWMKTVSCWREEHPHRPIRRNAVPSSVESLNRRAEKEIAAERYERALNFYYQSLKVRDTATVRRRIALILAISPVIELRDSDSAQKHAARAFELASNEYTGLKELFEIYLALDDTENAEKMYEILVKTVDSWTKSERRKKDSETRILDEYLTRLNNARLPEADVNRKFVDRSNS